MANLFQKFRDNSRGYWFVRKTYGWGWTPAKWQGWAVLLAWFAIYLLAMLKMDHESFKNLAIIFIATGLLLWICYLKGEKPRWQWGKKK